MVDQNLVNKGPCNELLPGQPHSGLQVRGCTHIQSQVSQVSELRVLEHAKTANTNILSFFAEAFVIDRALAQRVMHVVEQGTNEGLRDAVIEQFD